MFALTGVSGSREQDGPWKLDGGSLRQLLRLLGGSMPPAPRALAFRSLLQNSWSTEALSNACVGSVSIQRRRLRCDGQSHADGTWRRGSSSCSSHQLAQQARGPQSGANNYPVNSEGSVINVRANPSTASGVIGQVVQDQYVHIDCTQSGDSVTALGAPPRCGTPSPRPTPATSAISGSTQPADTLSSVVANHPADIRPSKDIRLLNCQRVQLAFHRRRRYDDVLAHSLLVRIAGLLI